jgi:hypothetical protein
MLFDDLESSFSSLLASLKVVCNSFKLSTGTNFVFTKHFVNHVKCFSIFFTFLSAFSLSSHESEEEEEEV